MISTGVVGRNGKETNLRTASRPRKRKRRRSTRRKLSYVNRKLPLRTHTQTHLRYQILNRELGQTFTNFGTLPTLGGGRSESKPKTRFFVVVFRCCRCCCHGTGDGVGQSLWWFWWREGTRFCCCWLVLFHFISK